MGYGDRMIAEATPIDRPQTTEPRPKGCELGRSLGECHLRRAGCGSLYDVLCLLYPPPAVIAELRSRRDLDPDVVKWLRRLEAVTT